MKKTIYGLICVLILILATGVYAEVTKTFSETDLVKLELSATDPDGDLLTYTFTEPLDENGEWQTNYGDEGHYHTTVTVSDGKATASQEVEIIILKKDRAPEFKPITQKYVNENEVMRIEVSATDIDGDEITYSAEGLPTGASFEDNIFTYKPDVNTVTRNLLSIVLTKLKIPYTAKTSFTINFIAESNDLKTVVSHTVTVVDVNRGPVLEEIEDIIVNEDEIVMIEPSAYDPDGDKIRFTYSGWMHTDSYLTNFDDAGEHIVTVTASDGLNAVSKDVKIIINDINRPPELRNMKPTKVKEGEVSVTELKSIDVDNDEVIYSLVETIDGAGIEESLLTWEPTYDTVNETANVDISIKLNDGFNEVEDVVPFIVENVNRVPVIAESSPDPEITVAKGARVVFNVEVVDLDGDEIIYTWQFSAFNKIKATSAVARTFLYEGVKKVKVIVSDDTDSVEKVWVVKVI